MRRLWLAVIVTALLSSLCWYVWMTLRLGVDRVLLMSAVIAPGRMALNSIAEDMKKKRYDVADHKLQALQRQWQVFERERTVEGEAIGNIMVIFSKLDGQQEFKPGVEKSTGANPTDREDAHPNNRQ